MSVLAFPSTDSPGGTVHYGWGRAGVKSRSEGISGHGLLSYMQPCLPLQTRTLIVATQGRDRAQFLSGLWFLGGGRPRA